jgi:hypothetical protein
MLLVDIWFYRCGEAETTFVTVYSCSIATYVF